MRRRYAIRSLLVLGAMPVAACGFRLRESATLPFQTLYTNFSANSALGSEFRRVVRSSSGTRIVDEPDTAQARLLVQSENREKEVIGFSTSGRPREYELRLRVVYRVVDQRSTELLPVTSLVVRREIATGDLDLLSKQLEEEVIYREMQSDLVQQMLRRLATIGRSS